MSTETGAAHDVRAEIILELQKLWLDKGLPDRADLALVMAEAADPWIRRSDDPGLLKELVWVLSGVAYRFTETPLLLNLSDLTQSRVA